MREFFIKKIKSIVGFDKEDTYNIQKTSILKILLLFSIILTLMAGLALLIGTSSNDVTKFMNTVDCFLFFSILYLLAVIGRIYLSSRLLSLTYLSFAVASSILWGVDVPQAILLFVISILIASILTSSRFTTFILFVSVISLIGVFYTQAHGIIIPDISWKQSPTELTDIIVYSLSIFIIFVISCLYNHEINKAFFRLKRSEAALKIERDCLEIRVQERTSELEKQHMEQISQGSRFIEFGKLSSGIFHDLANHLNVLMLMMDDKMSKSKEVSLAKEYLEEFREAKGEFEKFLTSNKNRLKQTQKCIFNPNDEIGSVLTFLLYNAKREKITFEFVPGETGKILFGSPLKFSHIISNLVSNAIDAYKSINRIDNRKIIIKTFVRSGYYILEIIDFGCGIKEANKPKVFNNFFTTNKDGSGLGLGIVRNTIKEDFGGIIAFDSSPDIGTVFLIQIPVTDKKDELKNDK